MKIGIDIDDTISCTFETVFPDSQKFDIEELGNTGEVQNYGKIENHHYIETMYPHWTEEQVKIFWEKYFRIVMLEAAIKPYATETIQKLKEEGNEIFLITSRAEKHQVGTEESTRIWLENHQISTEHLLTDVQDKGKVSKELQLDILIDDSIEHCRNAIKQGTRALLMTSCMNEGVNVTDLDRAYSWIQIYQKCHKIQDEKQN